MNRTIISKLIKLHILTPGGLCTLLGSFFRDGISLMALLRFAAKYYPEHCALTHNSKRLNYTQFYDHATRLAKVLHRDYGLKAGMRVGVLCRNHTAMALLLPALSRLGVKMKLLNTAWGFALPAIATPFMIMMFRQNSRNFPTEIMNAARIDGLSEIGIFFRIYLPVMKSTYAAAAVITFMNSWNAYLWPRVVLNKSNAQTMPILIANLANGYSIDYGLLMMAVLFCSLPTIIIFFILQKQFAEGITGAVK